MFNRLKCVIPQCQLKQVVILLMQTKMKLWRKVHRNGMNS